MSARPHSHPCAHCKTPVECGGELEQNHDGWPEVICRIFHREPGPDFLCESCALEAEAAYVADLAEQEAEERS